MTEPAHVAFLVLCVFQFQVRSLEQRETLEKMGAERPGVLVLINVHLQKSSEQKFLTKTQRTLAAVIHIQRDDYVWIDSFAKSSSISQNKKRKKL